MSIKHCTHPFVLASGVVLLSSHTIAQTAADYELIRVVDTVVNNTDPNLTNTDLIADWENSIGVNPEDPTQLVILGFSGSDPMTGNAALWHSSDSGQIWSKLFTIPQPPGFGVPNDQTLDWGRNDELSITFLTFSGDVVSVVTTDPTSPAAFNYLIEGGIAQRTNNLAPGSFGGSDQPWLIVNRDPFDAAQDNVYVGYDDFNNSDGIDGPDMRVAVSYGSNPLDFIVDNQIGNSTGGVNPGLRMFKDTTSGAVYALWGRCVSNCGGDPKNMDYMMNRSTDGGVNWSLNGNTLGAAMANANSTQPWPKFGTVNALLGGAHQGAADPNTGAVYHVYANQDALGNDRLAIRRIVIDAAGNATIGAENFVTLLDAALPQVAVDDAGTVAVFYYSFDGLGPPPNNLPTFTAHVALSDDQGVTFLDTALATFESYQAPTGDLFDRQRILGDYENLKAIGNCFYGTFTANGDVFGRPFDDGDAIFFQMCLQEAEACLFASEVLDIRDRTLVTAVTGAGEFLELGSNARINGSPVVDGDAFLRDRATINGDLTLSGILRRQNIFTITGTLTENVDVDVPELPTRTFPVGTGFQFVANDSSAVLSPGTFGNMTLRARSQVTFAPGVYNFASLNIEPDVRVTIMGNVEINVQGQFQLGDRSQVSSSGPDALLVYSNATTLRLGTDTVFRGRIIAPFAQVSAFSRADIFGCIGGRRVTLEPDVLLDSQGATLPL
jgi:hypothetical protein